MREEIKQNVAKVKLQEESFEEIKRKAKSLEENIWEKYEIKLNLEIAEAAAWGKKW